MHIVGPRATELIAEGCSALELEATAESSRGGCGRPFHPSVAAKARSTEIPDAAVAVIRDQTRVRGCTKIVCPHDRSAIEVGDVVHSVNNIWCDDDQMMTATSEQRFGDGTPLRFETDIGRLHPEPH